MKWKKHIIWVLFMTLICLPVGLFSQQTQGKEHSLSFFRERARQDAEREQSLRHGYMDEVDYWKDQKNFEKAIKKLSYKVYQMYLQEKRDAYLEHGECCDQHCDHSSYYYRMAAFYSRYDEPDRHYNPPLTGSKDAFPTDISVVNKTKFR